MQLDLEAQPRGRAIGSHQSAAAKSHTWLTPPEILAALGEFDLDPCACPPPRPWPTAREMWTREDTPLKRAWPAEARVWLNPPFGPKPVLGAFMGRMAAHGHGTALLFARTETEMFFRSVWGAASAVLFLRGRLNFHRQTGARAERNCGAPVMLVAYGADDAAKLRHCGIDGKFIRLRWGPPHA